ncbi:MAG: hypothetical protein LBQ68_06500 [Clostridiales bacterium]|nr:hypothetical protein [Clostridiales bacterium]
MRKLAGMLLIAVTLLIPCTLWAADGSEILSIVMKENKTIYSVLRLTSTVGTSFLPENFVKLPEVSPIVRVDFVVQPDFTYIGPQTVTLLLVYDSGDTATVAAQLVLEEKLNDTTPPVFEPILNRYAQINSEIDYITGIAATDDSGFCEITVDSHEVDPTAAGRYRLLYTATDAAGNSVTQEAFLALSKILPQTVFNAADGILKEITTDEMTQKEKARAIFDYVVHGFRYTTNSEHNNAIDGAHQAFTRKSGDCFIFYSSSEVLLTRAGIPNIQVRRLVTPQNGYAPHYWNLIDVGEGWYYYDSTPIARNLGRDRFYFTESELQQLAKQIGTGAYFYDESLYPKAVWE